MSPTLFAFDFWRGERAEEAYRVTPIRTNWSKFLLHDQNFSLAFWSWHHRKFAGNGQVGWNAKTDINLTGNMYTSQTDVPKIMVWM